VFYKNTLCFVISKGVHNLVSMGGDEVRLNYFHGMVAFESYVLLLFLLVAILLLFFFNVLLYLEFDFYLFDLRGLMKPTKQRLHK